MFVRRLWILLGVFLACSVALIVRLFCLQVLGGEVARAMADAALVRAPLLLPPVRGPIVDRSGVTLAADEPAVDVCVHYGVLSMSPAYLQAVVRDLRREALPGEAGRITTAAVTERIRDMWSCLAQAAGLPLAELAARRNDICQRVERLRRHTWQRRRELEPDFALSRVVLAEERTFHPVLRDVPSDVRTKIELQLSAWPFVRLTPSVRRRLSDDADVRRAFAQLTGSLAQATPAMLDSSPDDDLAAYRPGDLAGMSGLERLGERQLRGRRGVERRDLDGRLIDRTLPEDGQPLRCTLDADLQCRIYAVLAGAVASPPEGLPTPTGAACAVILLPSREVLALVSFPSYDPRTQRGDDPALRDDPLHRPLVPRVIADQLPPGSLAKPAALLTALARGAATPATTVECRGALFPDKDAWHCWTHWRQLPPHGPMTGLTAIQHSCNVYFYTMGGRLGAGPLTNGLGRFFFGPAADGGVAPWAGTGLIEERDGRLPTPDGLGRELTVADARNYAIGQGEFEVTPLQAASLMATIACGDFLPPTLVVLDEPRQPLTFPEITARDWSLVRSGLFRCANEPGGTAFPEAHLEGLGICGKTGSAESVPVVVSREFEFEAPDGGTSAEASAGRIRVVAPTVEAARERLGLPRDAKPVSAKPVERLPPAVEGKKLPPTHAWFAGFAPRDNPKIAISVLMEFGGGGGRAAAPVGRRVFEAILASPHGYLPATGVAEPAAAASPLPVAPEHDE